MAESGRTKLASRLHSAAIHLLRRVRREDAAAGLSASRLSALSVLVFGGPRTIGELAAAEQVTPPSMTRLVAGLEAEGYVERERDPRDRRLVRVRAAPRGRRVLEEGRERRVVHLRELLDGLPDEDLAAIGRAVALLEGVLARPPQESTGTE